MFFMESRIRKCCVLIMGLFFVCCAGSGVRADNKKDNSGTNPINFTYDWRTYIETLDLGKGDNSLTIFTIEQRFPISKTVQFRFKVRQNSLSLDPDSNGTSTEVSGRGDTDARVLWVPIVRKSWALATGLEGFFDTASNDFLGSGKTSLGPQIFLVKFRPGLGATLMALAYQEVFDVAGSGKRRDVSRSAFDFFMLWLDKSKKWWVLANPQFVVDHDKDIEFGLLEAEYGRMMFGPISNYIRPSLGIGDRRPYEWSAEFGFKVIWR